MPGGYRLFFYRDAAKDLRRVPEKYTARIVERIGGLSDNPRPHGCEKLSALDRYRLRRGDWRILYEIDDEAREVTVVKIGHRREIYRK